MPILRSGGVMSVSSYGSRSRLSTCFLTKPPFLRAYTVASPSCSTSASSPPASPSSPSASEQQTMRRPHLLDECSLHCGSLAASTAVVDGSPAQRASASHLIRCMTERGPRGRELSAKPPGVKTNAVLYISGSSVRGEARPPATAATDDARAPGPPPPAAPAAAA